MKKLIKLGFDIGSTTIKIVATNFRSDVIYSAYKRHYSSIDLTFKALLKEAYDAIGDVLVSAVITGSGGVRISEHAKIPFIQEVVATANALHKLYPQIDVAIELGGEDAKIIYLKNGLEQRMNGICAGGTGSFVDQMASLLQTDAEGLNEYAKSYNTIYPIASRCGVFAKSDIQPLINEGASKEDLGASIFQAVVNQTVSGLACGKPIKGTVAFLGGPLHYLSELRSRFIETLKLGKADAVVPDNSNVFAALGAAISSDESSIRQFSELISDVMNDREEVREINRLEPLFKDSKEYLGFIERHDRTRVKRRELAAYKGDAFLGIDAGSTTTKVALISDEGELLYSFYGSNEGKPLATTMNALNKLYEQMPNEVKIRKSCVTGYGEHLIKAVLKIDLGEIETVAHYKAAQFFMPDVDFILDIGGQDMKCMRIKDGTIDNVLLNEACSAGCGSFIETFAKSLNHTVADFASLALASKAPIDLGSRCTVFMNSRVKQAQKEGADVSDISAGLAYSVIKNALYKVIKIADPKEMGKNIVVQGGTFHNNAILKCFEDIAEKNVIRPDIAGLMGAFGAAVIAMKEYTAEFETTLVRKEAMNKLHIKNSFARCKSCTNNCLLTVSSFGDNEKYISGNRCEKAFGTNKAASEVPNLFAYKNDRLFSYKSLSSEKAYRGKVGIPRVLNMYENYPFWHTFFTELGYEVVLSPFSSKKIYELGMESIPSESACYPAKLVHGHIMYLINEGINFIFYPSVAYETEESTGTDCNYNCPIVTSYPENIKNNVEELRTKKINYKNPFLSFANANVLANRLVYELRELDIYEDDIENAVYKAFEELKSFKKDIRKKGEETLRLINEKGLKAIVLAGRPYHLDPEINHGLPELICGYDVAVLTEDSISHLGKTPRPLGVRDQWVYHSRLYAAADFVIDHEHIDLVQLNSFGCGLDAVTTDEVARILGLCNKIYTCIKIDEVNSLGSARIRIRSLIAAQRERRKAKIKSKRVDTSLKRREFTREMRKNYTILCPQMSPIHFDLIQEAFIHSGYRLEVMPDMDKESIDYGLRYVNNDACYPALITIGQLIKALQSGEYDPNKTAVLMSQTGGGCRASNYIGFLRKALHKANLDHVPVISLNPSGFEKNPGFKISISLLNRALQGLIYGDVFMKTLYKIRPYESVKGSAERLYNYWRSHVKADLKNASLDRFSSNIWQIVADFDKIAIDETLTKPKVGVVGEILVKYSPTANNDVVALLENEGAEAVVPELAGFLFYSMYNVGYKEKYFGFSKSKKAIADLGIKLLERYQKPMLEAFEDSKRFHPPEKIKDLSKMAEPIVSMGNQTGEGWFLTAEMIELIHSGINNILCAQPFACLPNHVTGKGVIKELKRLYPLSNVVAIDYDPGASEVNQLNRIKLMLSEAVRNMHLAEEPIKTNKYDTVCKDLMLLRVKI